MDYPEALKASTNYITAKFILFGLKPTTQALQFDGPPVKNIEFVFEAIQPLNSTNTLIIGAYYSSASASLPPTVGRRTPVVPG